MNATAIPERAAMLDRIVIGKGSHGYYGFTDDPPKYVCVNESIAWLAGEPNCTDAPSCVAPSIRKLLMNLNDKSPDGPRQILKSVALDVIGTAYRGDEQVRLYAIADWAVREIAPMAMDAAKLPELAKALRRILQIVDRRSANAAIEETIKIRDAAIKDAAAAAYAAAAYAYAAAAAAAAYAYAADAYAAAAYAYDAAAYKTDSNEAWTRINQSAVELIRRISK